MKKEIYNTNSELARLHEDLEKHVEERTIELQNAIHKLEAFTYTISHDMESPLRAIKRLRTKYDKCFEEYEAQVHDLKYHDQLTGLYNRRVLNQRLDLLIKENKYKSSALIFIDVDDFKYVNDVMGHTLGDLLLIKISERVIKLQKTNCTFYRLGGDEFAVLIEDVNNKTEIEKVTSKILKEFKISFELDSSYFFITLSTGIAIYPYNGVTVDDLLKNADCALYKAKELGRNRTVFYNKDMNEEVSEKILIEKNLRTALENNEFELYYQPQFDIGKDNISGFEALIRWRNPELGFVQPLTFIGIAEETKLIIPIGNWVLRNACIFLKKINEQNNKQYNIAVNISVVQLMQEDFVDRVIEILDSVGLSPSYLELEITESILMESHQVVVSKLNLLRKIGIEIALDDFGIGYSSLNYLKQLPINTLKIDKSFVDTISKNDKSKSLINMIVDIGENMGLSVIAEGVETEEQMDYLVNCKCHKIQGYIVSKPMPETEIYKLKY